MPRDVAEMWSCAHLKNCAFNRVKYWGGGGIVTPFKYSPRRRNKKKFSQVRLMITIYLGVPCWEEDYKAWRTVMGIGRIYLEGGSTFL